MGTTMMIRGGSYAEHVGLLNMSEFVGIVSMPRIYS